MSEFILVPILCSSLILSIEMAPGIVEKIKTVTDKPIKYLVNTHHHPDHVGGNEFFIRFAILIAHDNVGRRCNTPKNHGRISGTFRSRKKGGKCRLGKVAGRADCVGEENKDWKRSQHHSSPSIPNFDCILAVKRFISGTRLPLTPMEMAWPISKKLRWFIREISFS